MAFYSPDAFMLQLPTVLWHRYGREQPGGIRRMFDKPPPRQPAFIIRVLALSRYLVLLTQCVKLLYLITTPFTNTSQGPNSNKSMPYIFN